MSRVFTLILFPSIAALFSIWINARDLILKSDSRIASGDLNAFYAIVHSKTNSANQPDSYFGQPFGQVFDSIPSMDTLYIIVLKLLDPFVGNAILSVNLLIILLIVLNSMILGWLFNLLKFPNVASGIALLVILSLPWQTGRIFHISLLPFMVCFLGIISLLIPKNTPYYKPKVFMLGALLGLFFSYFALYGLIMFLVFSVTQREIIKYSHFLIFPLGAGIGFALNYAYSTNFFSETSLATDRGVWESHIYGGVPFLPWIPLPWNSPLSIVPYQKLLNEYPAVNESEAWSNYGGLGISILLLSFLSLRIYFLITNRSSDLYSDVQISQFLLTFLVMFAFFIRDGLGIAFSALISPQFRAWNRITPVLQVLVVILAFKTFLLLKEHYSFLNNISVSALIFISLSFLIWTQFSDTSKLAPKVNDAQEAELKSFAQELNRVELRSDCSVFQYPVLGFPEIPPYGKILDYDSFLVPLYVDKYTWSYGTLKTKPEFQKLQSRFDLNDPKSQGELERLGFCGIVLDNYGSTIDGLYVDQVKDWRIFQRVQSSSGRWIFYAFTS